jgi:hypothetical protein
MRQAGARMWRRGSCVSTFWTAVDVSFSDEPVEQLKKRNSPVGTRTFSVPAGRMRRRGSCVSTFWTAVDVSFSDEPVEQLKKSSAQDF